jgi:hypothetical protein
MPILIEINAHNHIELKPNPTYKFMLHPANIHANSPQSYANLCRMNLCTTCSPDALVYVTYRVIFSNISYTVFCFKTLNNWNEHQLIRATAEGGGFGVADAHQGVSEVLTI